MLSKPSIRHSSGAFYFELGQTIKKKIKIYRTFFMPQVKQAGLYLQSSIFGRRIILVPENLSMNNFELTKARQTLNIGDNMVDFVIIKDLPWGRRETFLLKELYRVLKKGGTLFLLIKNLPLRMFLKAIFAGLSSANYQATLSRIGFCKFDFYMVYPNFSRTSFLIPLKKQAALLAGLNFIRNHPKGILGKTKDLIMLILARLRILPLLFPDQAIIVTK